MNKTQENTEKINLFLKEIGLWKNDKPLAKMRDFCSGPHYDLVLSISPESGVSKMKNTLSLSDDDIYYYEEDGSQYWCYTIKDKLDICFESYRSGSWYLTLNDLTYDPDIAAEEKKDAVTAQQAKELAQQSQRSCLLYQGMPHLYNKIKEYSQYGRSSLYIKIDDPNSYQEVKDKLIFYGYSISEWPEYPHVLDISWK